MRRVACRGGGISPQILKGVQGRNSCTLETVLTNMELADLFILLAWTRLVEVTGRSEVIRSFDNACNHNGTDHARRE